ERGRVARTRRLGLFSVRRIERLFVFVELELVGAHAPPPSTARRPAWNGNRTRLSSRAKNGRGKMARRKLGEGQTALVTGASAGIGVDLAECFAKDGYDLILTARSEAALQEVANRLSAAHGVKAHTVAQDLGAYGGGSAVAAAIAAKGLNVDVVVNNAGYGHAGALTSS